MDRTVDKIKKYQGIVAQLLREAASTYTNEDLVGVLEEHHIPKKDIVLAFHAPYKRPFTGYAVA